MVFLDASSNATCVDSFASSNFSPVSSFSLTVFEVVSASTSTTVGVSYEYDGAQSVCVVQEAILIASSPTCFILPTTPVYTGS